ncbi:N-terminal nucleophile aminohydrolase [Ascodesmis nigricans]|uniref:N-terminal nucleophile aminohydrolase n=1 Tax=Ascodesmis nigricans TaxID=341454 RepID=A0A4S2N2L0_9PEZI|nr:N-terminal nucleophile aminohydrolase [Ascodesmis nigricans]
MRHGWNPYTDNGGSIIGIAGDDFVILAGDTRHTSGYNINSRDERKVYRLGENSSLVLATVGFGADAKDLAQTMRRAVEDFKFQHNLKDMTVSAAAQFLCTVLYGNRFFPKYAYCILGGLDKNGKARLYSYDPVGSYSKEGESRAAAGAASSLIVPFLDNQVEFKNQYIPSSKGTQERPVEHLDRDTVVRLVKDAFTGATERHIEVGDGLQIVTVSAQDGYQEEIMPLKRD